MNTLAILLVLVAIPLAVAFIVIIFSGRFIQKKIERGEIKGWRDII